ncbi:tolB protein precursor protein [Nannocystis sp. SCPEA4]|uniref:tolB protein precursor protein n=1 Tax=Nannocystis sp. SCPEA4 TaxID=2996787 RepID=UPI00226F05A8|nr:tolB protein precursor protein [Nannocystis sp. SCPEA4]MCY1057294.1 tolB protein precursor protein [Nannocystis sp. SCPEA4]
MFLHPAACGAALALACGAPASPASPTVPSPAAPAPAVEAPAAEPAAPPSPPLTAEEREAAGGRIFYLAERDDGATVDVILPSGQGAKTMLSGTPGAGPPSVLPGPVAPNGEWMAVITVDEHEGAHDERIEVRPLGPAGELGEPVWRSDAAPQVRSPNWSPDSRTLAFEAAFSSFRDIYALDLADKTAPKLRRLTDHPAGNYEPAFSPDGRQIAFVSSRDGNAEVYVMRADGSEPQRLTHFQLDDWGPVWSRDGGLLAFISNRESADRIFVCKPDGSELRRLTPDVLDARKSFEPGEAEPVFTPDGKGLVYSVRTGPQKAALRRADLATGAIVPLTAGASSDREPTFAPDGKLLVFASDRDGDPELYLMRLDGTGVTRLTERKGADWLPRWSPR